MFYYRSELDLPVIWNLCGVIKGEMDKWSEEVYPSIESLEVTTLALCCVRNSFVKNCPQTQLMVRELFLVLFSTGKGLQNKIYDFRMYFDMI